VEAATPPKAGTGFSSRIINPSNTPTPPGTWLASPSSCARRNAPRNERRGGAPLGRRTYNTAPARTQSHAETTSCVNASVGDGNGSSKREIRIGARRMLVAAR
jgi:hypothetical protein